MTLIELMLVIVIMAIVMAFAVPAFVGLGRGAGLRSAVNGVRSTLSLSRQWAITHREDTTFFCVSNGSVCYYGVSNQNGLIMAPVTNTEVTFVNNNLTFKSDGGLKDFSSGNEVDIIINPIIAGAAPVTIKVYGLTGGVKVR